MLNQNEIRNNWSQIKPQILGHWSKVTDAELEKTKGNVAEMDKLIVSKYGASSQQTFDRDLEKICDSFTARPVDKKVQGQKDGIFSGTGIKAAPDEYQSPQNPKRETLDPQARVKK